MPDYINIVERAIIDDLRDKYPNASVYAQFPEAAALEFPAIILELNASGVDEKFMGEGMTFGGSSGKGEIYGLAYRIHIMVERNTSMDVSGTAYKQRRLLNYLMLNIANNINDLTFVADDVEVVERHLRNWEDVGYAAGLELWGATTSYLVYFKNYRSS